MENEVQRIAAAQQARWQHLRAEVTDRGTPRLIEFRKDFADNVQVTIRDPETGGYAPFLLKSGRPLMASECLPERADIALDEQGRLYDQATFEQRYLAYLDTFVVPSSTNLKDEPIPRVTDYINAKPDIWTSSRAYVEIDFDPTSGGEFVPQYYVNEKGESVSVEEYNAKQADREARDDKMEALLLALGEKVLAGDTSKVVTVEQDEGEATVVPLEKQAAASQPVNKERAACGKFVKKGYVAQHARHCQDEACGGGDGDEAA